jgi:hypothetical protein
MFTQKDAVKLLSMGFITGSRGFGTAHVDSDWDIAIWASDLAKCRELLEGCKPDNVTHSLYNNSEMYIYGHKEMINIIPLSAYELRPWWLATKALASTLPGLDIINPIHKYALFEAVKASFKGIIEPVDIDNIPFLYAYPPTSKASLFVNFWPTN